MSASQAPRSVQRFQGWEVCPDERRLLVRGAEVSVGGRAFDLLCVLVASRGRVVGKDELLDAVWPGLVVEENNISVQIAALRKLLGPGVITTVAGRGYQLSALPLVAVADAPPPEERAELLGRQHEVQAVLDRLAEAPLVTLVGPGGVGKTALARETSARRRALTQWPVAWVDLAPVRDEARLVPVLAKSLGVDVALGESQAESLIAALGQARGLVVVDNCEHLQPALAAFLQRALASGCGLAWLATSQLPLGLAGESVVRLDPLSVPPRRDLDPAQAMEYGAVALLCKRVADVDRRFRLGASNVASVIALCEHLDGLPLAIEMAAVRVAAIGLAEVQGLLGQRLKLSPRRGREAAYRHATLQATYDWSHGLLAVGEQVVFRRLEPFLGSFSAELAQQVARDDDEGGPLGPWEVLDALAALVDKSLVQRCDDGSGRFRLLESARDYARSCLQAAGEFERVQRRHARAVARFLGQAQDDAATLDDHDWCARYLPESHNARAALVRSIEDERADDAACLVCALAMMDAMCCRQAEVLQLDIPLDLLRRAPPRLRADACLELSWAHFSDADHRLGVELAREAHELYTELGDAARAYRALAQLTRLLETVPGMTEEAQSAWRRMQALQDLPLPRRLRLQCAVSGGLSHQPEVTIEHLASLGREAEQQGFDAIAAIAACNLTDSLLVAGRDAEVVQATERAVHRHAQASRACACMLHNQALALIRLGRFADALAPARQAFRLMPAVAPSLVDAFALAAARQHQLDDAAVLHGCSCRVRDRLGYVPDPAESAGIGETAARLAAELPAPRRRELMAVGAAMTPEEALTIKVFGRPPRATDAAAAAAAGPASSAGGPPAS